MPRQFRFAEDCEEPISTPAAYAAGMAHIAALKQEFEAACAAGGPGTRELLRQITAFEFNFRSRLPYVLVSRCPFCATPVWELVGIFSLQDPAWFCAEGSGRDGPEELGTLCPHLFCVDGALNLNGQQPTEAVYADRKITMAAEVPFVKPRVLNLPTMVAVVHSLPVADRYTAYPITYFCEQQPEQKAFCIPWSRVAYFDSEWTFPEATYTGRRSDIQDYDLAPWIERGQLFWLGPDEEDCPVVRGPVEAFPYHDLPGRRQPYYINKQGRILDRKPPTGGRPRISREFLI